VAMRCSSVLRGPRSQGVNAAFIVGISRGRVNFPCYPSAGGVGKFRKTGIFRGPRFRRSSPRDQAGNACEPGDSTGPAGRGASRAGQGGPPQSLIAETVKEPTPAEGSRRAAIGLAFAGKGVLLWERGS